MRYLVIAAGLAAGLWTAAVRAEVVDVAPSGFEIRQVLRIAASPQQVWAALVQPGKWWSSDHTFSGSAANMTMVAKAGGCWCEALKDGGSVQHMTVSYVEPGKTLVLRGALGPFFDLGADGAMTWALSAAGNETDVTLTFRAGGYVKGGFTQWSAPVDQVLTEQFTRLKRHLEPKP